MTPATLDQRIHAWRPDLADAALDGRVAAERFVTGEARRVTAAQAAVRPAPDATIEMATEALCGEAVQVFETTESGFAWVQLVGDSYVGYMEIGALGAVEPAPTHRVAVPRTPVFSRPDIKAPPIGFLPMGASVTAAGEAKDRNAHYMLLASGGSVVKQHLAAPDDFERDFVAVAEQFVETPYLWGGKTALGLDCSGLLQVSLAACGNAAPRDTDMQEAALGVPIDAAAGRKRGDLVFWKGHVAIATGPNELLHANAHAMLVSRESADRAIARFLQRGLAVSSVRRLAQA